ncbi:MAG: histone deacetylase family protein [Anaerolineae bacterium]|nr:histone deacetylase family protein [Thermoflexales bacterium]MDW8408491.1 histone deacetylase family protein [Anaerolineae bacterium]
MRVIYSDKHHLHDPPLEYWEGEMLPFYESPRRAEMILRAVRAAELGPIDAPSDFGLDPILAVHDADYVHFLQHVYPAWVAGGRNPKGVHPDTFAMRGMVRRPRDLALQAGYYSHDVTTVITAGTWQAAYDAAQSALTAAHWVAKGEPAAFAVCRPPGHHAHSDLSAGYCFLNNAAIAAHWLTEHAVAGRANTVALLDIDFHHGNGSQQIFYTRRDVFYVSLHADPERHYPYFLGGAEERGSGEGYGYNLNVPLPAGVTDDAYLAALDQACIAIERYDPVWVVVSLGVDTFVGDPIGDFALTRRAYPRIGARIAQLNRPTVFIMEGGYAIDCLGENVACVLTGFLARTI